MSVKYFDKTQNKWVIFPGSIGAPGRSAYELAVQQGYKGTLDEWLLSLKGKDAYTIAVEGGYKGTEEEFNNALTTAPIAVDKINNADLVPTKDSVNLVLSGGVKDAIDSLNTSIDADLETINNSITTINNNITNIVNTEISNQIKSSIVDNLTSSEIEKSLSARQGKILKELIDNLANLQITVVDTLPTTGESNIIYLVKKAGTGTDIHDEYVYVEGNWEKIGTTDVDLTNYYTKTQVDSIKDTLDNKISNNTLSITNITTNGSITPESLKIQKNGVDLLDAWNGSKEGVANIVVPTSLSELNATKDDIVKILGYTPADSAQAGMGDVTGPVTAVDGNLVAFDKDGKHIKDSQYNVGSFAVKNHTHTVSQITDFPEIPDPITVDDTLSTTSTNPVQNKVVATALNNKVNNATLGSYVKTADLNVTLGNYYTTAEVYTKNEVDDKIGSAGGGDVMASGDLANNYIIIGAGSKSIKKSEQLLSDLALKSDIPSLDGYATESWVGTQNFITMPDDLAEDRIVIGAGTNSVTSKRLKTINGISLLVDDTYNVTNYNVSRMFPWDAFTGRGNITGLYNYLFDGVGQLVPIEYNNSAYTNLPVDGESFVGTLQPYKYTATNNWSVRAFLTSENTGKTYTGVFNMGQSALINWIEIGKDITSSEIISALGFTPISSNEIPIALPNPHALSITANRINNSYTGSSAVNINLDSIFSKKLKTVTTPGQPGIFVGTESSYEVSALYVSADEPDAIIVIPSSTSIAFNNTIYTEMQDLGTLTGGAYKCYCITYINSSIVLVNGAIYGNS